MYLYVCMCLTVSSPQKILGKSFLFRVFVARVSEMYTLLVYNCPESAKGSVELVEILLLEAISDCYSSHRMYQWEMCHFLFLLNIYASIFRV